MNELETALTTAEEAQKALPDTADDAQKTAALEAITKATTDLETARAKVPKQFTQDDVDRLMAKTRDEEKKKYQAAQQKEAQRAEEAKQAAAGEWKTIAETREARIAELETVNAAKDRDLLRSQVAAENKLPAEIGALLQGDTREAMTAHAKTLAKHIAPLVASDTEGGTARPAGAGASNKAKQDEIKRQAERGHYASM